MEGARALLRLRQRGGVEETLLGQLERSVEQIWARTQVWELTRQVCALAQTIAPARNLKTLDAIHLATFSLARTNVEGLELLTADAHLAEAAAG